MSDLSLTKEALLTAITEFFLKSNNFNGIQADQLCEKHCDSCIANLQATLDETAKPLEEVLFGYQFCKQLGTHLPELRRILEELVQDELITVVRDLNPHIKRYPDAKLEKQIENLSQHFNEVGLYPSPKHLAAIVPANQFSDEPFTRRLLLGEPQMTPVYFELDVLDVYASDARFDFRLRDYNGGIHLKEEFHEAPQTKDRDRTFLEHFGLGYEHDGHRCVVVWLYDLTRLTPEHQQRWKTYLISDECKIDPDYYRNAILGEWAEKTSIYQALLKEMEVINTFCSQIGWPPLFRETYSKDRPHNFRFPFRATREAYHRSVEVLDKMLSQNLNLDFFKAVLPEPELFELRKHSKSGLEAPHDLGTLKLLSKWLSRSFRPSDGGELITQSIKTLETIRAVRQKPAHKIEPNVHGKDFYKLHDRMIHDAFDAVRTLRLVIANHPNADSKAAVPEWLYEGRIREFRGYDIDDVTFAK